MLRGFKYEVLVHQNFQGEMLAESEEDLQARLQQMFEVAYPSAALVDVIDVRPADMTGAGSDG